MDKTSKGDIRGTSAAMGMDGDKIIQIIRFGGGKNALDVSRKVTFPERRFPEKKLCV